MAEVDPWLPEARARHAARIASLDALVHEQLDLGARLTEGLSLRDAAGEGGLRAGLRRLLERVPGLSPRSPGPTRVTLLEQEIEALQRQLVRLDLHLERLAADREALEAERVDLDARLRGRSASVEGVTLRAALGLHDELIQLNGAVQAHLRELAGAARDTQDALDRQLRRLAAEAKVKDLAGVMAEDLDEVRAAVARVNRCAAEGAVLLTEDIDRLADEVDLLSPDSPEHLAAQGEVAEDLKTDDVQGLLRATRARVRRRRALKGPSDA